jgi:hypothetical protein
MHRKRKEKKTKTNKKHHRLYSKIPQVYLCMEE